MTILSQDNQSAEHSSFEPAYFSALFEAEKHHFWFRTRSAIVATIVRQVTAKLKSGYRVLEVGCGSGNMLHMLEQTCQSETVIGMDLFAEGLHFARQRTNCALVQGDMHASPFGVQFEIISLFDVIEHLPDDRAVLDSLHTMLVPGGTLLLTVPAFPTLWSYFDEAAHHCRRYERAEMERKLIEAGYEVEYLSYFMATIFPLTWFNRRLAAILNKKFRGKQNPPINVDKLANKELRIVPIVNQVLIGLLSWEKQFIKRRKHLPFGTSLLVVARKVA